MLFGSHILLQVVLEFGSLEASQKPKILFLCSGNSCRSLMAEGGARHLLGDQIEPFSAGIEAHGMNEIAVALMADVGVDISRQSSKLVSSLADTSFDFVVTVCGNADDHCPSFPGKTRVIHRSVDDPPKLPKSATAKNEAFSHYQRVRDEIRDFVANELIVISQH